MIGAVEQERRRAGAQGAPVRLADGQHWLLASPTFRPRPEGLTQPQIDCSLDRIFDSAVLGDGLDLGDLWGVARELLRANYDLTDDEIAGLLSVAPGPESRTLAAGVVQALFGPDQGEKSYSRWVRASLIAGGLAGEEIPARDLPNVLAILVATNRTIPLSRFADACRLADERARLEALI
jgi:hypothetical protein